MTERSLKDVLTEAAENMSTSEVMDDYAERHGMEAAPILTVHDDETAHNIVGAIHDRIAGRTVIEIGGGIGLLALHMGTVARRVWCIEANHSGISSLKTLAGQFAPNVIDIYGEILEANPEEFDALALKLRKLS